MEARAVTRYVRVSASKARLVVDQIRGKNTDAALETLAYTQRAVAEVVEKTLNSAIANAVYVKEAYVNEGPTWKRIRPRAKGSASRIRKRTSHITIVVANREEA